MINQAVQNYVGQFLAKAQAGLRPSADTPTAPNPFMDDRRLDIGFQKFLQPAGFTTAPNMAAGVSSGIATGGSDAPKFFSGDLGVGSLSDLVEDAFVSSPYTTNPLVAIGQAASKRNLKDIQQNIIAGEEGYGLGYFQGRLIGVRPGGQLSGVLPEGMTLEQQRELASNILATNQRRYQFDYDNPLTDTSSAAGLNPSFSPSAQPAPEYTLPPAERPSRDPGGSSGPADTSSGSASAGHGGLGGQSGGPRATGGTVGFAEGGTTQKDPIQRTGFVEGPPQEYAKGTTVADTENLRVKEGSFVINAPMTEKLQEAGVLPKGNQKRKAAKGGNMMEVALSKGEYVVEPKDVPKFGGYNFLEAVTDMGKPEVERRQAMQKGGKASAYSPTSRDLAEIRKIYKGDKLARYNEQTGEYELAPRTAKEQKEFTERQQSFLQKQPYVHMGDVEYAQSMMAKDRIGSGYIEEGLFVDPMDSVESFKNRGLDKVFPLADAQLVSYFTEIPEIIYGNTGHIFTAGSYNPSTDIIKVDPKSARYIGGGANETAYHEILHRAFEKKFQRNLPLEADNVLSASDLVEAYSADQRAFYPPDLAEELQKLDLLKEEANFGTPEYRKLETQIDSLLSKAREYEPDSNHSALTLHVIDNSLKTVEKAPIKNQIKTLNFVRHRARYYLPDPIKHSFDVSQAKMMEKKYPKLYALSDDDYIDLVGGNSNDQELNAQHLNYLKDTLITLKKIHSDATVEYRIALAASDVEDVVTPTETRGSQTYERGFLRDVLDRNLQRVDAEEAYPRYFVEQQRRRDSSATR